jgi:hypothetical protein
VAYQDYLYVLGPEGNRDDSFEDKLGELDRLFGDSLWDQIANYYVDLCDESVRKFTALQMAVMYRRNPAEFDRHKLAHTQLVDFLSREKDLPTSVETKGKVYQLDTSTWPAYRDATEDDMKREWFNSIKAATDIAELFMKMRWSVVVADVPTFITTDNPVAFVHPSLDFRGINSHETLILFPLSPTRILLLDHKLNEPDGQYYPLKDGVGAAFNGLLWRNANEHMFSAFHSDIVCAEMVKVSDDKN